MEDPKRDGAWRQAQPEFHERNAAEISTATMRNAGDQVDGPLQDLITLSRFVRVRTPFAGCQGRDERPARAKSPSPSPTIKERAVPEYAAEGRPRRRVTLDQIRELPPTLPCA
jgi:hypothetical protein